MALSLLQFKAMQILLSDESLISSARHDFLGKPISSLPSQSHPLLSDHPELILNIYIYISIDGGKEDKSSMPKYLAVEPIRVRLNPDSYGREMEKKIVYYYVLLGNPSLLSSTLESKSSRVKRQRVSASAAAGLLVT